ncbi:hypothetical protein [Thalassolituus sp. UBA2009]|jgi:hypothetical protein|uniref:hypothetical protein n=1 Tax=Thalassolituus sp. UBA2009 TaxID=1947658 RepID=UPI002580BFD4|nr:hypothetical protein [Thalassolituus sp. UBA2009]
MNFQRPTLLLPILSLAVITLSACSVAPLTTPTSARSLGKGNVQLSAYVAPATSVSFAAALGENTDAGVAIEQQITINQSIWIKHSLLNQAQGWSVAGLAGLFSATDLANSKGFYLGPLFSYSKGKAEWYGNLRYNRVYWDGPDNLSSEDKDDLWFDIVSDSSVYSYWQADVGMKIHRKRVTFNLGATCLELGGSSACMPIMGAGLTY